MNINSYLIEAHIFRIINNKVEFLLIKRSENDKYPNIWQPVTGTIDENEPAYKTALREVKEETGINPIKIWVVPHISSFYSYENDFVSCIPVFAILADKNSVVTLSEEHSEYKWLGIDDAKTLVAWPDQRESMEIINEYFSNKNSLLKFILITM